MTENLDKTQSAETTEVAVQDESTSVVSLEALTHESKELINQIIAEQDIEKTKDLTQLFNLNQNKKTIARLDKLSALMDTVTDRAIERFSHKPDEIPTTEILTALKTVQDTIKRSQKQVSGVADTPLIQINQQNNEVNVGDLSGYDRESRNRVKNAVLGLLGSLTVNASAENIIQQKEAVEVKEEFDGSECKLVEEDNNYGEEE